MINWFEMTLNYWIMMERYPNLKEEVGGSIPGYEISSLLDRKTCQVVNCLLCFGIGIGMSAFCLKKNFKKLMITLNLESETISRLFTWVLTCAAGVGAVDIVPYMFTLKNHFHNNNKISCFMILP